MDKSFEKQLVDLPKDKNGFFTLTYTSANAKPDDRALLNHLTRFCIENSIPVTIQSITIQSFEELHSSWCCFFVPKKKKVWTLILVVKV